MHLNYRTGAMGALLDEYEKAINELKSYPHTASQKAG
jgi:hypothetical protein